MKTSLTIIIFTCWSLISLCQNYNKEIHYQYCDTIFFTKTEYPVRLKNDLSELQKNLRERLTLYPEDKAVTAKYLYRFKIDCEGRRISSEMESTEGPAGLSIRILKLLDENCKWGPAMNLEQAVNAFYSLTVLFKKGNIEIVPQKKDETK